MKVGHHVVTFRLISVQLQFSINNITGDLDMFQKETAALLAFHIKDLRKGKYLIVSISRRDSRFFFSKIA